MLEKIKGWFALTPTEPIPAFNNNVVIHKLSDEVHSKTFNGGVVPRSEDVVPVSLDEFVDDGSFHPHMKGDDAVALLDVLNIYAKGYEPTPAEVWYGAVQDYIDRKNGNTVEERRIRAEVERRLKLRARAKRLWESIKTKVGLFRRRVEKAAHHYWETWRNERWM